MQLKQKNGATALLAAVLITGVFSVAAAWHTSFDELRADLSESVLSMDPGYSFYPGLKTLLQNMPAVIDGHLHGFAGRPSFETVYIDINPEEYRTLLQDRDRAVANNVLIDPHEVKAKIRFHGRRMRADARLKGDLIDHWLSKRRMSLRIKLKNGNSLLGYTEFSIQKPQSRQHPYDAVFQSVMRSSGNLSSVREYVNVVFNGKPWGIMIMEEAMTSAYLEKLDRKASLIVRMSNEDKGVIEEQSKLAGIPMYQDYRLSDDRLYLKMYGENKYADNPDYRKWYSYIAEQRIHGTEVKSHLYDIDAYGKALFIASLWNDGHPLWYSNARHYFNPYTLQLQPITTDAFVPFSMSQYRMLFPRRIFDPLQNNSVFNSVLSTRKFQDNADAYYRAAAEAVSHAGDEYRRYHDYFPLDPPIKFFIPVLEENTRVLSLKSNRDILFAPRDLDVNYEGRPPSPAQLPLLKDHVYIRHFDDGTVDVYNLLPDTVHLNKLTVDGLVESALDRDIPPYDPATYEAVTIHTNFKGLLDDRLAIETVYADQTRVTHGGLTLVTKDMYNPLLTETAPGEHEYLTREDGRWRFAGGKWDIDRPLVLDGDLVIPPGTTLRFADNAYLIVKGAIQAVGDENAPIIMTAQHGSWKGIYVLKASDVSHWRHVAVSNYTALQDGLLSLTGGITFYRSDVAMDDVELDGSRGEDAVNLVKSHFEISNLKISDTASDGLDSDFSNGVITASSMTNIKGDALDFSGSTVAITDIAASNIHDKGVSVGEASDVSVNGGEFDDVGAAVVSKDGSRTSARNVRIGEYVVAGAMAYQKKSFYDHPSLELENITVAGESPFIRQKDSMMTLNGQSIREQDINVDYLYENTVMKK